MKYIIHYNGAYQDSLEVEGDDIAEITSTALEECARRGWKEEDCWSEKKE